MRKLLNLRDREAKKILSRQIRVRKRKTSTLSEKDEERKEITEEMVYEVVSTYD